MRCADESDLPAREQAQKHRQGNVDEAPDSLQHRRGLNQQCRGHTALLTLKKQRTKNCVLRTVQAEKGRLKVTEAHAREAQFLRAAMIRMMSEGRELQQIHLRL